MLISPLSKYSFSDFCSKTLCSTFAIISKNYLFPIFLLFTSKYGTVSFFYCSLVASLIDSEKSKLWSDSYFFSTSTLIFEKLQGLFIKPFLVRIAVEGWKSFVQILDICFELWFANWKIVFIHNFTFAERIRKFIR